MTCRQRIPRSIYLAPFELLAIALLSELPSHGNVHDQLAEIDRAGTSFASTHLPRKGRPITLERRSVVTDAVHLSAASEFSSFSSLDRWCNQERLCRMMCAETNTAVESDFFVTIALGKRCFLCLLLRSEESSQDWYQSSKNSYSMTAECLH